MLTLQRASAGSGKTFTLAKHYIRHLLGRKDENGKWHLRKEGELKGALSSLLAITFTNKATNEMKQRIIDKLSALASATDQGREEKIDYIDEFKETFGATTEQIAFISKKALETVLNHFSSFAISTIDSFFQTILRTFSYEANLTDNYQVEIDNDFVSSSAIDATLNEIDTNPENSSETYWLELVMREFLPKGNQWNAFNKSDSKKSLYTSIKNDFTKLDNEEYKAIRENIESYFDFPDSNDILLEAYEQFKEKAFAERRIAFEEVLRLKNNVLRLMEQNGVSSDLIKKKVYQHLTETFDSFTFDMNTKIDSTPKVESIISSKSIFLANKTCNGKEIIDSEAMKMYVAFNFWKDQSNFPVWMLWKVLGGMLPVLGLMNAIRKRSEEVLVNANLIKIDDTKTILSRIVNGDDTSFIYERLGTRINHYMIDEFQDTSKMQWDILYPLVAESNAKRYDNLIIGDAKQSIYRFRNADPSLITHKVAEYFPHLIKKGDSEIDNTNWRSDKYIVEFNNLFFLRLSELIAKLSSDNGNFIDFNDLYSNVVQKPHHKENEGYVEIRILNSNGEEIKNNLGNQEDEDDENEDNPALKQTAGILSELIGRGYSQKDIAILVDTNDQGKVLIDYLMKYNSELPEDSKPLEFISEESLYVSSSEAVNLIVTVLERISGAFDIKKYDEQLGGNHHRHNRLISRELIDNFTLFSLKNDQPIDQLIENYINETNPDELISMLLADLQTTALPALVESIIETFIPEKMKSSQAVFISAFQDFVIDYCERHTADPASFLQHWKTKQKKYSISLPEDVDAIRIMTVHKSKGLEFNCVILPYATSYFFPPKKNEWRWVRKPEILADLNLPAFLPVRVNEDLMNTEFADVWQELVSKHLMDRINSTYVAFTRAVKELYIVTDLKTKKGGLNLGSLIKAIFIDNDTETEGASLKEYCLPAELININENKSLIPIGQKQPIVIAKSKNESDNSHIIKAYLSNSKHRILHFIEDDLPETSITLCDEEDADPRSEGNILHEAMSMIIKKNDVKKAFLSLQMRGLITHNQAKEWQKFIESELTKPPVSEWYSGEWEVMNERNIFQGVKGSYRPDRMMIDRHQSKAVIIDYKFGEIAEDNRYRSQVKRYMRLLKEATGIKDISGFIWYVRKNVVEDCRIEGNELTLQ